MHSTTAVPSKPFYKFKCIKLYHIAKRLYLNVQSIISQVTGFSWLLGLWQGEVVLTLQSLQLVSKLLLLLQFLQLLTRQLGGRLGVFCLQTNTRLTTHRKWSRNIQYTAYWMFSFWWAEIKPRFKKPLSESLETKLWYLNLPKRQPPFMVHGCQSAGFRMGILM